MVPLRSALGVEAFEERVVPSAMGASSAGRAPEPAAAALVGTRDASEESSVDRSAWCGPPTPAPAPRFSNGPPRRDKMDDGVPESFVAVRVIPVPAAPVAGPRVTPVTPATPVVTDTHSTRTVARTTSSISAAYLPTESATALALSRLDAAFLQTHDAQTTDDDPASLASGDEPGEFVSLVTGDRVAEPELADRNMVTESSNPTARGQRSRSSEVATLQLEVAALGGLLPAVPALMWFAIDLDGLAGTPPDLADRLSERPPDVDGDGTGDALWFGTVAVLAGAAGYSLWANRELRKGTVSPVRSLRVGVTA